MTLQAHSSRGVSTVSISASRVVIIALLCIASTRAARAQTPDDIVLYPAEVRTGAMFGEWARLPDSTAAGGAYLIDADSGQPQVPIQANPTNYFELRFWAEAGRKYHVWMRGRATGNSFSNDAVWFQFSSSVDAAGAAIYRIGSTDALKMQLQEYQGAPLSNWGWHDSGWGVGDRAGDVYFVDTGYHTLRVQTREDGLAIDQVLLTPSTVVPGAIINDSTIWKKDIAIWASDVSASDLHGAWALQTDATAAGGYKLRQPNAGLAKVDPPLAAPTDYFEHTIYVQANVQYRLWMRGKADSNDFNNDAVSVQFTSSRDENNAPAYLIGTTSAVKMVLQEYTGASLSGWGWHDNGWGDGVRGPVLSFATSGAQTIRVQNRDDGLAIDQLILSPVNYLSAQPGASIDDTLILASDQQTLRPDVTASASVLTGAAPLTVNFSTFTTPGGASLTYSWNFDDGSPISTAAAPSHVFSTARTYKVTLTATGSGAPADIARFTIVATGGAPSTTTIKVLNWNIAKGRTNCTPPPGGSHVDCPWNLDAVADKINEVGAHVVALTEVRNNYGSYTENQPAELEQRLEARTNQCWDRAFTTDTGGSGTGHGMVLLWRSTEPCGKAQDGFVAGGADRHPLPAFADGSRSATAVQLTIAGRSIPFIVAHLCSPAFGSEPGCTSAERQTQVADLKSWAAAKNDPRIIAGDFNATPASSEMAGATGMAQSYVDLWVQAVAAGTATPASSSQPTHVSNWRPDYIWLSKNASPTITLQSMQIIVTGSTSDHYPMIATFEIQ